MLRKIWRLSVLLSVLALFPTLVANDILVAQTPDAVPSFRAEVIDSKVIIGYGTAIGDVDGDGKPDILLADKKQFVWYQNPSWKRHVLAENLTEKDNVCIAARDIDGDGKVEIAVGGQWNPGDTVNSGAVFYLVAPEDRTQPWRPIRLHHEPVVHRMRWVKLSRDQFVLVVAPLHGRGNKGAVGDGVKLLAYYPPENPAAERWGLETLDDQFHVTHNFDIGQWDVDSEAEEILYYGQEGAKLIARNGDRWKSGLLKNVQGGGEIRLGRDLQGSRFLATIEPFHGSTLAVYSARPDVAAAGEEQSIFQARAVLDDNFNQGHAVAVADLLGNGSQQIVAGWRNPNRDGQVGVKIYYRDGEAGAGWKSRFIDENGMACEDLRIGDLNGDGRPEIVAAGRSSHNLKIYWNEVKN